MKLDEIVRSVASTEEMEERNENVSLLLNKIFKYRVEVLLDLLKWKLQDEGCA